MTDTPERALLRRLMEARRAFHSGPMTPEKFAEWDAALAAADALLAEPEGEALDPRTEYERFIVGWVAQHAPEVSERAGAAYREVASRPTPRSRAEAEAMVDVLSDMVQWCCGCSTDTPCGGCAYCRARALLAARKGEG